MASHDPQIASAAASKAALTRVSGLDAVGRRQQMAAAHEGMRRKLIAQVDPTGELEHTDPAELERQLAIARRLRMADIALKSAQARRERAAAAAKAAEAEEYGALVDAEAGAA